MRASSKRFERLTTACRPRSVACPTAFVRPALLVFPHNLLAISASMKIRRRASSSVGRLTRSKRVVLCHRVGSAHQLFIHMGCPLLIVSSYSVYHKSIGLQVSLDLTLFSWENRDMDNNKTWYEEFPELTKFKDDPVEKLPSRIRRILQERRTAAFVAEQRARRGKPRPGSRRAKSEGGQEDGTTREGS